MVKKLFLVFLLTPLFLINNVVAQQKINVQGKVIDKKTKEPVIFCVIHIKELEKWTITDSEGNFKLEGITPEVYTLETECLGYEKFALTFDLKRYSGQPLTLQIAPATYDMKEVTVVAQKGKDLNTSTVLSTAAIEHVQATSLGDIMQLIPGNIITNPDLADPQQLSIREIGSNANSAMGTALIVDGAPITNDGNMQVVTTAQSLSSDYATGMASTVAGGGVDIRAIPTENIESIEVIKGIPSVIYGDLTSGAVVLKTKSGRTPLELKLKTDPKNKQFSIGQGFNLTRTKSAINYNLEYSKSNADLRSKFHEYQRITGSAGWSKTFFTKNNPLSVNLKYSFYKTIDETKTDPDAMTNDEEYNSKEVGHRINFNGKWQLNKALITDISYSFSYSNTHQDSYQKRYRSGSSLEALSVATIEGENIGLYLPAVQLTEMTIDGRPITFYGQITAKKVNTFKNKTINTFLYGVDYKYTHNSGDGSIYDITNPPYVSSSTARPRSFDDIPAMKTLTFYFEDKLTFPIGSTRMTLQAGARINNFQASGLFKSDLGTYFEPRTNMSYELVKDKHKKVFKEFTLNLGIGRTYKAPSMLYLYPDMAYKDLKVMDWFPDEAEDRFPVFYTKMFDTSNPDLEPTENLKKEIGVDFNIAGIRGNVTFFDEKVENELGFESHYESIHYYTYDPEEVPDGTVPDLASLTKNYRDYFVSYQTPMNISETKKKGIEFDLRLGKVKSLYTEFSIDGAWLKTTRVYNTKEVYNLPSSGSSSQYEYLGVYAAGESRESERFNTNLRMVTHIPDLRLMITTTLQMIWIEKYNYPFYDKAPSYLINKDGDIIQFTNEMRTDPQYVRYVTEREEDYWQTESFPPLFMANLRLSKEISDNMSLSMYVNNFSNYRPLHEYDRSPSSYSRRNSTIYFGAELKIKL